MIVDATESRPLWRMYLMGLLMVLGLILVVVTLAFRQLAQGAYWLEQMAQSSSRVVKIPAARGRIIDRNGIVLADNRPSFNVALFLDEFGAGRSRKKLLQRVADSKQMLESRMKMPVRINEKIVRIHYERRGPLPLTVWNDLSPSALATFSEQSPWTPGVDLSVDTVRIYPFGSLAIHIIGYVGKPESSKRELELDFDSAGRTAFAAPSSVGKAGIEGAHDMELQGTPGQKILRLNAAGFKEGEVLRSQPTPGNNVILSIDSEIQTIVEEAFTSTGHRGACVLVDPNNGDIIALASVPCFNPNAFVPAIKRVDWQHLMEDESKPMFNRALQGAYHPGSTFKIIGGLAGLESGLVTPHTTFSCSGVFNLGPIEFACWEKGGHGDMQMREAITMSCNVFFYNLGQRIGGQRLWEMSHQFGLGEKTGIPLDHESAGLLGNDAWKRKALPREGGWTTGDSVNMAIGQGFLDVTPLQMAMAASVYANGGTLYRPRLMLRVESPEGESVVDFPPLVRNVIRCDPKNFQLVREAMLNVVKEGTGRSAGLPKIKVAGKTGSAQTPRRDPSTGEIVKQTHTWFVGFAPYDEPRYAFAVIAERGESGGRTAAPIIRDILQRVFLLEELRKTPNRPPALRAVPVAEPSGTEGEASGELLGSESALQAPVADPLPDPEDADEEPPVSVHAEKVVVP